MATDALTQAEDALAEMCWCGHPYWNHSDGDTPVCWWPGEPDADDFDWEPGKCSCTSWWPMNEDPPDGGEAMRTESD